MAAAGVGIWAPGENPGTHAECLAAVELALDAGGGDVNAIDKNGETALHGAVYRGGNIRGRSSSWPTAARSSTS